MPTKKWFVVALAAFLVGSCGTSDASMSESEFRQVVDAVTAGMNSYAAALRMLEAGPIMAHYLESPEFRLTSDGTMYTRDAMRGVISGLAGTLSRMEVTWESITVTPLAPDVGLAVAPFRTSNVAKDDTVSRVRGVATWVWVRRNGEWRMLYGHGDHYPDTDSAK